MIAKLPTKAFKVAVISGLFIFEGKVSWMKKRFDPGLDGTPVPLNGGGWDIHYNYVKYW